MTDKKEQNPPTKKIVLDD